MLSLLLFGAEVGFLGGVVGIDVLVDFGVATFEGVGVETFDEAIKELFVIFCEADEVAVGVFGFNTVCIALFVGVGVGTGICDIVGVAVLEDGLLRITGKLVLVLSIDECCLPEGVLKHPLTNNTTEDIQIIAIVKRIIILLFFTSYQILIIHPPYLVSFVFKNLFK